MKLTTESDKNAAFILWEDAKLAKFQEEGKNLRRL